MAMFLPDLLQASVQGVSDVAIEMVDAFVSLAVPTWLRRMPPGQDRLDHRRPDPRVPRRLVACSITSHALFNRLDRWVTDRAHPAVLRCENGP